MELCKIVNEKVCGAQNVSDDELDQMEQLKIMDSETETFECKTYAERAKENALKRLSVSFSQRVPVRRSWE